MAICGGCARRREAIKQVGRAILNAVRPAKAPPPVDDRENAGRALTKKGWKRLK